MESICEDCKNQIECGDKDSTFTGCTLCRAIEIIQPTFCSHFNPKPKLSNELKERRKEAIKTGKEPRKKRKHLWDADRFKEKVVER